MFFAEMWVQLGKRRSSKYLSSANAVLLLLLVIALASWGDLLDTHAAASTNAAPAASTNSAAIPLAEIAAQIEATTASVQSITNASAADPTITGLEDELPVIRREINARLDENSRIISRNPSLQNLRRLNREWHELSEELDRWNKVLTKRATQFEADLQQLSQSEERWQKTTQAADETKLPAELLHRIQDLRDQIHEAQDAVQTQHAAILVLQTRVTEERTRINQALQGIDRARTEMLQRLFVRDSPALWDASLWSNRGEQMWREGHHSLGRQFTALVAYAQRKSSRFLLHGLVFFVLLGALLWARHEVHPSPQELGYQNAALLVRAPIATALLLSLLVSGWMYPQAPRLLWAVIGAFAILPATLLLRRLLDSHLMPVLAALVGFYFFDQLRSIAASQGLLSRCLFLAEALAGGLFSMWLIRSRRLCAVPEDQRDQVWKTLELGARVACITFLIVVLINAVGYQTLSKLICNALLASAYLAMLFYALVRIVDSFILVALSVRPVGRLQLVSRHRAAFQARARRLVWRLAFVLWVIAVLNELAVSGLAFQTAHELWNVKAAIGSHSFTVGDVLLFALTVWAAFFVSSIVRFALEEEVYPRIQLAPGLYYSISQMLHYTILLTGFFVGITLLGVNLTKLTILAGAFGVGVGFGLQNIINNFVSGIILLFERPVKVGDLIEVGNTEGIVKSIGIRATIVRTISGSEIVIPNGKLISDPLTNWTFSNRQRLITIPVAVAPDAQPERVIELMEKVAKDNDHVVKQPAPQALFTGFAGGALNFELRAWTDRLLEWSDIRSELALATNSTLLAQKITLR